MDWKETVTSVSDHVFPGLSHKIDNKLTGNEVLTNLPLQMSLYFNVVFAPFWTVVIVTFLIQNVSIQFYLYSELNKFIVVTIITTIFVVEILRLSLGYEGNLRDKIPELAGFWMLSLLLQFPLQGFLLLNPYFGFYILEVVAQGVMFSMLVVQLISGYCALKYTATKQATYFRIMKLRTDISLADIENRYRMD